MEYLPTLELARDAIVNTNEVLTPAGNIPGVSK